MGCTLTTEEVAHIDRTIAALKSERDGYAGQLTRLSLEVGLLRKKNTELLRANDKLRELINVMAYCMQQGRDCDGCAANGADGVVTAPSGCDWLRDRMRELGVVE